MDERNYWNLSFADLIQFITEINVKIQNKKSGKSGPKENERVGYLSGSMLYCQSIGLGFDPSHKPGYTGAYV